MQNRLLVSKYNGPIVDAGRSIQVTVVPASTFHRLIQKQFHNAAPSIASKLKTYGNIDYFYERGETVGSVRFRPLQIPGILGTINLT